VSDVWSRPVSKRTRRALLAAAIAVPFGLPLLGAAVALATGSNALYGAILGVVAAFVVIGATWILLGVVAARRELRSRRHDHDA
jgi:hypothetical protein